MAINFPDSPNVNDTYSYGGNSWTWDGSSWVSLGGTPVAGPQGPQGPTPYVYLQKTYNFVGGLTVGTGTARFYPTSNVTLRSAYFTVGTSPTTGNASISVIKNNTTTLNVINIIVGNYISTNTVMDATMTNTDFLTVTTSTVGGATANGSLSVIYTIDNNPTS